MKWKGQRQSENVVDDRSPAKTKRAEKSYDLYTSQMARAGTGLSPTEDDDAYSAVINEMIPTMSRAEREINRKDNNPSPKSFKKTKSPLSGFETSKTTKYTSQVTPGKFHYNYKPGDSSK
jgi:hypothetical protein